MIVLSVRKVALIVEEKKSRFTTAIFAVENRGTRQNLEKWGTHFTATSVTRKSMVRKKMARISSTTNSDLDIVMREEFSKFIRQRMGRMTISYMAGRTAMTYGRIYKILRCEVTPTIVEAALLMSVTEEKVVNLFEELVEMGAEKPNGSPAF